MIQRFKYKLCGGKTPKFPNPIQLGMYPSGDFLYGEVNSDADLVTLFPTAQIEILTDEQAISYLEGISPSGVTIQPKLVTNAPTIVDNKLVQTYSEIW